MKELRAYKIDIFGLSNSSHHFDFHFTNDFFSLFENSLIDKGEGSCEVELIKSDAMINLKMKVAGFVELVCDRSLELFHFPIEVNKELIYKYGDEEKELSEDVFVITKDKQDLNIGSFLYETISLEVPMKKLHPKFQDTSESDELVYSSEQPKEEKSETDPRWDALKNLK